MEASTELRNEILSGIREELLPHLHSAEALVNFLMKAEHLQEWDSPEEIVGALAAQTREHLLSIFEKLVPQQ